ncbi:MAG: hypothetical protein M5U05_13760 [Anaerolineales bacterium]|nr:hypothetical protein [Anaerolineales bacterium]
MNQEINQEFFDHLVQLAELQLEPEEAEYMHEQLNKQLQSVAVLQSIPVDPGHAARGPQHPLPA